MLELFLLYNINQLTQTWHITFSDFSGGILEMLKTK